jgi:plastocyanin
MRLMRLQTAGAAKTRSMPAVSILALAAGLLVLAGCGSSSSTTSSASTPAASTPASATTPTTATPTTESSPASTSTAASAAPASGSSNLSLEANPQGQLKYNTTSLTAKAGKVSIDFTNMAPEEHNMTIESSSHAIVGNTPTFKGGAKTLSLNLKPGTYKFFCSVPGHRMAGMEGTLTVTGSSGAKSASSGSSSGKSAAPAPAAAASAPASKPTETAPPASSSGGGSGGYGY